MMGLVIKQGAAKLLGCVLCLCLTTYWATPTVAEVTPCVASTISQAESTCTNAQADAFSLQLSAARDYPNISREHFSAYLEYLQAILDGYTPNDSILVNKISELQILNSQGPNIYFIHFRPTDVFETYDDDIYGPRQRIMYMGRNGGYGLGATTFLHDFMLDFVTEIITPESCGKPFCNRTGDRVVAMLGGGLESTKDSQYVDSGFRVTSFAKRYWSDGSVSNSNYHDVSHDEWDTLRFLCHLGEG